MENVIYDSTSVVEVQQFPDSFRPENLEAAHGWLGHVEEGQVELSQKILEGADWVEKLIKDFNLVDHGAKKNLAERAILMGLILLRLKEFVKQQNHLPWEVWASENLPFINERNRAKFMLLARREDCHALAFLGVDRLEILCGLSKEMEGENRIGDFLAKYQIPFNPEAEANLSKFKMAVDAAINCERLERAGLEIPRDLVLDLTLAGIQFDKKLLKKLKREDDPVAYLNTVSLNGGKLKSERVSKEPAKPDFNSLAAKLIEVIGALNDEKITKYVNHELAENLKRALDHILEPRDQGKVA